MTYLEIVNSTLRRLRRQEVSSVSFSTYSQLIGDLVNLAKREVEDAWDWVDLQTQTQILMGSAVASYRLTSWGERYRVHRVSDQTNKRHIQPITRARYFELTDIGPSTIGPPQYWVIASDNYLSTGDPVISVWPTPNENAVVAVYGTVAQADLTVDSTTMSVPTYPVLTGAYLRALDERGEDQGTNAQTARADYRAALADAITQDNINRVEGRSSDWHVQ